MKHKEPLRGLNLALKGTHQAPRVPSKPPSASPLRHGAVTTAAVLAAADTLTPAAVITERRST
jgi:hypothetical protein